MRLGSEHDFEVVGEASNGETALVLAEQLSPDIVLLDVNMPGLDGLRTAAALHLRSRACRVVMVSMSDDNATRQRAIEAGAAGFVSKQEGSERLVTVIRSVATAAQETPTDPPAGAETTGSGAAHPGEDTNARQ